MRAGRLDRRVVFEQPVESQDSVGELTKSWQDLPGGDDWVKKEELDGRELFQAQQINAQITTRLTLRWRSDVDARMRVLDVDDGLLYSIHAAMEGRGRRRQLVLLCSRSGN